MCAATAKPTT